MQIRFKKTAVLFIALFSVSSFYSENNLKKEITFPYKLENNCPYKGCKLGKWRALAPIGIYHNMNDKKKSEFYLKKGESFTAIEASLIVEKPGIVRIIRPFENYKIGDEILLIGYKGEGYFTAIFNNIISDKLLIVSRYNQNIKIEQIWTMYWWVKIKRESGQIGWLKLKNQTMNGFKINEKIKDASVF